MTLFEFKLLSEEAKIDLLYEHGVYIGKRKELEFTVLLFQLESFYVKVFYKKYRCFVERIQCFSSTVLIDPFLEQIDLEPIVYN